MNSVEKVNYKNKFEMQDLRLFLKENELNFDEDCDYTIVLRDSEDRIVATASKTKNILKCFAIDSSMRGEGVSGKIVTDILNKMFSEGYDSSLVFTKVENLELFINMGYKEIASTDRVSLLEIGVNNIGKVIEEIKKEYGIDNITKKSMIVMNCNPFTLGHQYLIEQASKESEEVIIFIVEEDKSVFPFNIRYKLVKEGCAHLKNVKVIPGTKYIISSATFPNYFLKKSDDALLEYTKLDVTIAGKIFCPAFNITKRYIGEEPFCQMTAKYNESIKEIFPRFGVEVRVIPRKEIENRAISATEVRKWLAKGDFEKLKGLIPEVTYKFLSSSEATEIIEKLKLKSQN
ncbi:MAG: [citrate (pro-3S)-lyase] ligase [Fusobacteriaceae bacterium]|nr:[citrate (pro-3S)-lyase] ligase [Fusobacteriaceae bacterium]MBP9510147.1 [citrate (pro-3S)-lyase] ligase [Fusobacteriaceae bacterium]